MRRLTIVLILMLLLILIGCQSHESSSVSDINISNIVLDNDNVAISSDINHSGISDTETSHEQNNSYVIESSKSNDESSIPQDSSEEETSESPSSEDSKPESSEPPTVESEPDESEIEASESSEESEESQPTEESKPDESEPPIPSEPEGSEDTSSEAEPELEPFDIDYWIEYARDYAESVGLILHESAVDCWDTPIIATPTRTNLKGDIESRLNRYAYVEEFEWVWIWAEQISENRYNLYVGYA